MDTSGPGLNVCVNPEDPLRLTTPKSIHVVQETKVVNAGSIRVSQSRV